MAVWDVGLPQRQFAGIGESWIDGLARSAMDAGPPKARVRYTAEVRNLDMPIVLTTAEKATFTTFYEETLGRGALTFTWTDPDNDTTIITFRFRSRPPLNKVAGEWRGIMNLEVLP